MSRPFYVGDEANFTGIANSVLCSHPEIASVNGVVVTFIAEGNAAIWLYDANGNVTQKLDVTVFAADRPLTYKAGFGLRNRVTKLAGTIFNIAKYGAGTPGYVSDTPVVLISTSGTPWASSSYYNGQYQPTNAFDGNDATQWASNSYSLGEWIAYGRDIGTVIKSVKFKCPQDRFIQNFKIQGSNAGLYTDIDYVMSASNDGNWVDVFSGTATQTTDWQEFAITNNTAYSAYRLCIVDKFGGSQYSQIVDIEFHGYATTPDLVPHVNLAVGGIATESNAYSDNFAGSKAFTGDISDAWATYTYTGEAWVAYQFLNGETKTVKRVRFLSSSAGGVSIPKNIKFQGSNDGGNTWTDLYTGVTVYRNEFQEFSFANNTAYNMYRFVIVNNWLEGNTYRTLKELEFYAS